jgi:hypothetical protein
MVLHGNPMHVAFNMLALFSFGAFLEKILGWRRFLILYVLSGLGGSLASLLVAKPLSVGASGGIWGLMVAGAVLVTWPRGRLPELVSAAQRKRAWTPVVINALYSFSPGIDWLAHLGGGLVGGLLLGSGVLTAGFAVAGDADDASRPPSREGVVVRALALVSGVALASSVALAWLHGRPWELQSEPRTERVEIPGEHASVVLPHLEGQSSFDEQKRVWRFGGLAFDPIGVVLLFHSKSLDEAGDVRKWFEAARDELNAAPPTMKEFSTTTPYELKEHEGIPYIVGRQSAADGRYADTYWVLAGRQPVNVLVVVARNASAAWKNAAGKIPFSITASR